MQTTLTEPKSSPLDALLECVVTKELLLVAVEQTLWIGSDAFKLSTPTGEDRHSNEQIPNTWKKAQ